MNRQTPPCLARVFRCGEIESEHFGHIVIAGADGTVHFSAGERDVRVFLRSAAKPVQAVPLVEQNIPHAFGLSDKEMALACASHNGEDFHIAAAASMLQKIGLSKDDLQCGVHRPLGVEVGCVEESGHYDVLQNNCSGKHAAMLAACVRSGLSTTTYLSKNHPHQQDILTRISHYGNVSKEKIAIGIDGCSAPVFNLPLQNLAILYARLADRSLPGYRCFRYMVQNPEMVGGSTRFDTTFMQAMAGSAIAKIGAEGLQCVAIEKPEPLGVIVKISDGNNRAAPPVMLAIMRKMGLLPDAAAEKMPAYRAPELRNHRGVSVGKIEAVSF